MVRPKGMKKAEKKEKKSESDMGPFKLKGMQDIIRYYELPPENLTFNGIMHKLSEVLEIYLKTLQQVLQPEEFHAIYECNAFTDKDKTHILEMYKRIIIAHREILKALIINEEQSSLSTIQFVHQEILGVKTEMLEIVEKMQQSWNVDAKDKTNKRMQYFG